MEQRVETLEKEVKEVLVRLSKIEGDRQLQDFQYKTILKSIDELKVDIKDLKGTPGKRWDLTITTIITAIISAIVTYVASKII